MPAPQIVVPDAGFHNRDLSRAEARLLRGNSYRDCSTVCVTPAIGPIPTRIVQAWMSLIKPMNQKFIHIFIENMEVGEAYSAAVDMIVNHPDLSKWKYMLTLETDNSPSPDGLLKLIEDIESGPKYGAVGSLYWTKGEGGQPMCYGRPEVMPKDFVPWLPPPGVVAECNGLGMGMTLFRIDMLKDARVARPIFRTVQEYVPGQGARAFTQDLWGFQELAKHGYRFACSTRTLTGHWDEAGRMMW
jgi:hypothetical protein